MILSTRGIQLAGFASAISIVVAVSCNDSTPEALGPAPQGPHCAGFDPTDQVHFKAVYPNGGETFHVGDTVVFRICSEDPALYSLEEATKTISYDNGANYAQISYETNVDGSEVRWVIPEKVEIVDDNGNLVEVPTVSNQCIFRVSVYSGGDGDPSIDYDGSDRPFSVVAKTD